MGTSKDILQDEVIKYRGAFNYLMGRVWDFIPEEERADIDKTLKEVWGL